MLISPRSDFHPWSRVGSITNRTAVYGSVRTVVWEVRRSDPPPIPIKSACATSAPTTLLYPVVRRLFGDDHVVHVTFAQTGGRNAQEARVLLQLPYSARAAVAHARAQPAHELIH